MAKLLKHFGWGVKKSNHQVSTGRSDCSNSTQKSNSVHELMPKSPSRYQSNVSLTSGNVAAITNSGGSNSGTQVVSCNISSTRSEYDTRSLKLNLDGSKQQQHNDKHQYQSLQKGVGFASTSGASKGKCDGFISPGNSSNLGSIESPEGTSSSESAVMPMIVDEYCDPLDLTETSSLMIDDDYSIPYDEVNKVLKDIQTSKVERLLNGISSNIVPVDEVSSADGQIMAKVPLKLTSSSQVTSLRIKPRRLKEQKSQSNEDSSNTVQNDKNYESKLASSIHEEDIDGKTNKEIYAFSSIEVHDNLSSVSHNLTSELRDTPIDNDKGTGGHLYSSNCTSGGCVTVMSTNNFDDFEPIDCGHMLTSLTISQTGDILDIYSTSGGLPQAEMAEMSNLEMTVKSDQSSQTSQAKCDHLDQEHDIESHVDLIHVLHSGKMRPKSDGVLMFSPKDSRKLRLKHIQNGKRMDCRFAVQERRCCECQCEDLSYRCQMMANHNYHGNKTLQKEFRDKDNDLSSSSKPLVKTCLNLPLHQQSWFHGQMGRFDAEKLLEGRSEGTFLVRISESNNEDFSLSLKSSAGFLHIKIVQQTIEDGDRKFILGQFSQPFESVASMVQFYQENKLPVRGSESLFLSSPLLVGMS